MSSPNLTKGASGFSFDVTTVGTHVPIAARAIAQDRLIAAIIRVVARVLDFDVYVGHFVSVPLVEHDLNERRVDLVIRHIGTNRMSLLPCRVPHDPYLVRESR